LAGSLRRCKETVKDIDIVASAERPDQLMAAFTSAPGVETVTGQGPTKSSVVLKSGMAADLRIVSDDQFPFALHHFTGSKEHNVRMRQRAKDRGMKVNEYGLFRGEALVPCADEEALFRALDLPWIPPELREDTGEFDAETLPNLVERAELNGIFHCHSDYSDGLATVEQMARAAQERGYSYLLMADHSQSAAYAGGLTPEEVARQHEEIDRVNAAMDGFVVLKGIESDIRADGSLDYPDEVLASFDAVVASVHSRLSMPIGEATDRLVRAVQNPYTTILGHPTGRLLLAREGYPVDFERLFDACAASGTAVEINASPHRLDLDWRQVKRARDRGVKLCIGPDAHRTEGLDDVNYGLGIARKGWLEASDLLNCMTLEEFLAWRK
jgi:DNA polymerase (family 10)